MNSVSSVPDNTWHVVDTQKIESQTKPKTNPLMNQTKPRKMEFGRRMRTNYKVNIMGKNNHHPGKNWKPVLSVYLPGKLFYLPTTKVWLSSNHFTRASSLICANDTEITRFPSLVDRITLLFSGVNFTSVSISSLLLI
jgi:hypothetical protein